MDDERRDYRDTSDTAFLGRTRKKLDMAVNPTIDAVLPNETSISVIYTTL